MPRFFVENDSINDGVFTLTGENSRHISLSLRMKTGEHITVCDTEGRVSECEITDISSDTVKARTLKVLRDNGEPPYKAVLCQAIAKGDKMDTIIQKAVELGVYRVIPFESKNCVARIKPEARAKKTERFRNIAKAAAKQCGRAYIPAVAPPVPFEKALSEAGGTRLFCYENERTLHLRDAVARAQDKSEFSIFIGPEGGYSAEEAALAVSLGADAVSLGRRILRTESAAPFVLACLSYALEV